MLTQQEIFDKVVTHFFVEKNGFSRDEDGCRYRGPNGTKCAVGIFIPDGEYNPAMEGGFTRIYNYLGDETRHFIETNERFLKWLQGAHDNSARDNDWNQYYERMRDIAREFDLDSSLLVQHKPND